METSSLQKHMDYSFSADTTPYQIMEYIRRDSAIWAGISLFYIHSADPAVYYRLKEEAQHAPDALLCESDNRYILLNIPGMPDVPGEKGDYLWTPDIGTEWQRVCDVLEKAFNRQYASPAFPKTQACNILVVEDDQFMKGMMERQLSKYGQVVATSNYHQAIANYTVQRPDIIFLDIHYKDSAMDGLDALKNIRIADENAFVVMVSGDGSLKTRLAALHLGACGFITKPFSANDFTHYIAKVTTGGI